MKTVQNSNTVIHLFWIWRWTGKYARFQSGIFQYLSMLDIHGCQIKFFLCWDSNVMVKNRFDFFAIAFALFPRVCTVLNQCSHLINSTWSFLANQLKRWRENKKGLLNKILITAWRRWNMCQCASCRWGSGTVLAEYGLLSESWEICIDKRWRTETYRLLEVAVIPYTNPRLFGVHWEIIIV